MSYTHDSELEKGRIVRYTDARGRVGTIGDEISGFLATISMHDRDC